MPTHSSDSSGPCPICGRELIAGPSVNEHHLIPRSRKGKETITLHRICHSKIHSLFSEKELAMEYNTADKLRAHPEMQKFIKWVRKKDPEFYDRNRWSEARKRKSRYHRSR